jgi:cytochrome c-type biogenesis protein
VMGAEVDGSARDTWRTFFHSLLFVLGFMMVFVLLGASATFIGRLLLNYSLLLQRVGGVLLVIFGMRLMGLGWSRDRWIAAAVLAGLFALLLNKNLPLERVEESLLIAAVVLTGADFSNPPRSGSLRSGPLQIGLAAIAGALNFFASYDDPVPKLIASLLITLMAILFSHTDLFYTEKKLELQQSGQTGYLRSLLFGVVFAAGWTPCVGPILAAILVVASTLQTVHQGVFLLTAYSLGLGIPFLVVGLAFGPLSRWLRRMNRYLGVVSMVSGGLLVLMGILIFTDSLGILAQYGNFFELTP